LQGKQALVADNRVGAGRSKLISRRVQVPLRLDRALIIVDSILSDFCLLRHRKLERY
jgi:hypothetical protein